MGLRDIEATLPPGFRFYPSDEELVCHYLFKKVTSCNETKEETLVEIDLHTCEPWQLPEVAKLNANEWYFFSFRDRKYATGFRTNRATTCGYWKATGKDRVVLESATTERVVGMRKTLVFYRNRAPNGIKTGWIMHEFRLHTPHLPPTEDWVLCRVFHKGKADHESRGGPDCSPQQDVMLFHSPTAAISFSSPTSTTASRYYPAHSTLRDGVVIPTGSNLEFVTPHGSEMEGSAPQEELGFLWDMGLVGEEDGRDLGLGYEVPISTASEMTFEDENSMVFL